jgi:putative thioredoxin
MEAKLDAKDVTDSTFETAVLERSTEVPVVVDLWAEWCGPCKTLGPIIEKVVAETGGQVELAKVDVDANPGVAQAFRVQSIPAVYALRDKQVVDHFVGAIPEAQVRDFVSRLAPSKSEADLLVERGDEASLRKALDLDPDHEGAVVGLAELLVDRGDKEEALALLARIPETAEVRRVAAMARLGSEAAIVAGNGELESRLDGLLERVKTDDEARQEFLDLLETMGADDPRTAQYRKALTSRLF